MHRAVDLLVEQHMVRRPGDPRIAADAELADPAGTLVAVEQRVERRLVLRRRRLHDAAAAKDEPDARELMALVARRELRELDPALRRVLERRVEELPARHVRMPLVDLAVATREAEREVCARADDPHLLRRIE